VKWGACKKEERGHLSCFHGGNNGNVFGDNTPCDSSKNGLFGEHIASIFGVIEP
jgi:hypothetical protein